MRFFDKIARAFLGKSEINAAVLDDLEAALLLSDVGLTTTVKIIEQVEAIVKKEKYTQTAELNRILKKVLLELIKLPLPVEPPKGKQAIPYVIMMVGVNGVGKTTSTGKLAYRFKQQNKSVLLAAADTFRAGAIEQLHSWSVRNNSLLVQHAMGTDPSAVAFEAVKTAIDKHLDVVIIDTAGRLHNKIHLMNELSKIKRVVQKLNPEAPQEVLLVIDATTGQNAIEQTKQFLEAVNITGLIVTKLDGTAKAGIVLTIIDLFKIPVRYVGLGEGIEHLTEFDESRFVESLFSPLS